MSGIRPEMFDYNAAVDKADAEHFDWNGLYKATQDVGFGSLPEAQRKHVWDLLRVKSEREHGNRVDPYAPTGELGALRQLGSAIKSFLTAGTPDTGNGSPTGVAEAQASNNENRERAIAEFVNRGYSQVEAEKQRQQEVHQAGTDVVRQFAHYFTGGLVAPPEQSKDVYVQDIMEGTVKPITAITAIAGQFATGSFALSLVSKVPLVSAAAENLSTFTRGMIKGGLLDFGINAAWPEGLSMENRLGVSDDISRAIAPQSIKDNPAGIGGRLIAGVGGALEGAMFGSAIYGFGAGVKLADAKYAFTVSPKMMERVKQSLEAAGVDISGMTRRDVMLNYRTRMTQHIQGMDEAVFNGERQSAESWVAQQFLNDPNITELTPEEGRLLYGVFSSNKGGVSVLKGIVNPEAALEKLRKVGINVDASIIPRRNPAGNMVANSDVLVPVTDADLDAAVELADGVSAKSAQTPRPKRVRPTKADVVAAEDRAVQAERRATDAERKAATDGLTGINNQGAWKSAQARVDADPALEVVSIDLANFKILNDKAGHEAGDMILQNVAMALKQTTDALGHGSQVFRTGGDEFVMVVPKGMGQSMFDKAKARFGSHLVEMRAGIGPTYKEADAAERAVRAGTKLKPLASELPTTDKEIGEDAGMMQSEIARGIDPVARQGHAYMAGELKPVTDEALAQMTKNYEANKVRWTERLKQVEAIPEDEFGKAATHEKIFGSDARVTSKTETITWVKAKIKEQDDEIARFARQNARWKAYNLKGTQ